MNDLFRVGRWMLVLVLRSPIHASDSRHCSLKVTSIFFFTVRLAKHWRLQSLCPWRYSKADWTWYSATGLGGPVWAEEVDKMISRGAFPPQQLCDSDPWSECSWEHDLYSQVPGCLVTGLYIQYCQFSPPLLPSPLARTGTTKVAAFLCMVLTPSPWFSGVRVERENWTALTCSLLRD